METLFLQLFNMSITAGWVILAVILIRLLMKRAPKWMRCILWAVVAVRLVCPFSFESVLSLIPSAAMVEKEMLYAQQPEIESGIEALNRVVNPVIAESFSPNPGDSVNPLQIVVFVASWVWLAGMILLILHAALGYRKLRRKTAVSMRMKNNIWLCDAIESPFVFGVIKPRIYLPSDLDEEKILYVTAHEKTHIRRHDHWWKLIAYVLTVIYWFHPLVWIAYILFCRDIELACDEAVISKMNMEDKKAYSRALVSCSVSKWSVTACPLAFGEVGVKERVKAIMNYKKPGFWIMLAAIVVCIVVAAGFLTNPQKEDTNKINDGSTLEEITESGTYEEELNLEERNTQEETEKETPEQESSAVCEEDGGLWESGISQRVSDWQEMQEFDEAESVEAAIDGTVYDYRRNSDGTWSAKGITYQYRLILSGYMQNSQNENVLVVLSNSTDITFDEMCEQVSGNDYPDDKKKDALIVSWYVDAASEEEENLIAIAPTGHAEGTVPFYYVFFGGKLYRYVPDDTEYGMDYIEENGLKIAGTIVEENNWELPDSEFEASHFSVGSRVYTSDDSEEIYVFDIWSASETLWRCEVWETE